MNIKLLIIIVFANIFLNIASCSNSEIRQGNEIVSKIEKFKSEKNRLPNNLTELGLVEDEAGPIYYEKKGETKFILWFGKALGESAIYDSDTKQWK